jgi:AraC-like DNA-binding protein
MSVQRPISKHVEAAVDFIKRSIDNNPLQNQRITKLLSEAGLDRSLLQSSFKQIHGSKIKEYEVLQRLEYSKVLLEEGSQSIKQIAYKCGYHNQNSYTKTFKKHFGITPKKWQSQQKLMSLYRSNPQENTYTRQK